MKRTKVENIIFNHPKLDLREVNRFDNYKDYDYEHFNTRNKLTEDEFNTLKGFYNGNEEI